MPLKISKDSASWMYLAYGEVAGIKFEALQDRFLSPWFLRSEMFCWGHTWHAQSSFLACVQESLLVECWELYSVQGILLGAGQILRTRYKVQVLVQGCFLTGSFGFSYHVGLLVDQQTLSKQLDCPKIKYNRNRWGHLKTFFFLRPERVDSTVSKMMALHTADPGSILLNFSTVK